jgi:hypothetical protein
VRPKLAISLLLGALAVTASAQAAAADGKQREEARTHFAAGVNLLQDPARPRYEEAYLDILSNAPGRRGHDEREHVRGARLPFVGIGSDQQVRQLRPKTKRNFVSTVASTADVFV